MQEIERIKNGWKQFRVCCSEDFAKLIDHIDKLEAENERLRKDAERRPMTDEDTLALFNRIQLRMRFTDADARPFASGVASAEFFHGIK